MHEDLCMCMVWVCVWWWQGEWGQGLDMRLMCEAPCFLLLQTWVVFYCSRHICPPQTSWRGSWLPQDAFQWQLPCARGEGTRQCCEERGEGHRKMYRRGVTDTFLVAHIPHLSKVWMLGILSIGAVFGSPVTSCWGCSSSGSCVMNNHGNNQLIVCNQQMRLWPDSLVALHLDRPSPPHHHSGILQVLNSWVIHSHWVILACMYVPSKYLVHTFTGDTILY